MTAATVDDGPVTGPARFSLRGALLGLSLLGAVFGLDAAVDAPRPLMARADYLLARKAIEGDTRFALALCRGLADTAKSVCRAEARARERILRAELEVRYRGTTEATAAARLALTRAAYDVAQAKCGVSAGMPRNDCLTGVRSDRARAFAAARLSST